MTNFNQWLDTLTAQDYREKLAELKEEPRKTHKLALALSKYHVFADSAVAQMTRVNELTLEIKRIKADFAAEYPEEQE